ncbi:hypothetical protein [Sphingomonas sp. CFBP 8764]|uniref:hypothetical protein n=1 Tax=Sphingomonas sp. CFBP 8764 TaxID=2775275 RepID=UPI00177C2043|nr:hypothetical protein [Sphingomonas sp. CFBP 8764]MBD8552558.1 hypothetical protein [Sphingomonas sp. CFBP 8764]
MSGEQVTEDQARRAMSAATFIARRFDEEGFLYPPVDGRLPVVRKEGQLTNHDGCSSIAPNAALFASIRGEGAVQLAYSNALIAGLRYQRDAKVPGYKAAGHLAPLLCDTSHANVTR